MNTHFIAAAASGVHSNGAIARQCVAGMAAQVPSRSLRKRISAMLRLACRVLGLKRRKGLGLALLGASGALLMAGTSAHAANGIHINANATGDCVSITAPTTSGSTRTPGSINFTDSNARCNANVPDQKDYVLFYRPSGVSGTGATSLTLGGELYINGGYLKLGDSTTGQRIGNASTKAAPSSMAIGNGAESTYRGLSVGTNAKATGSDASTAIGNNAVASGFYGLAVGADAQSSADRSVAVGSQAKASADGALALGYNAEASGSNAFAVGVGAKASGNDSVAIGANAAASHGLSVALGSGTSTRAFQAPPAAVLNGKSYTFDSANLQGVVSVGGPDLTRQIINVAPGIVSAQSLDAVNGSQLFAAYDAINALGVADRDLQAAVATNTADVAATRASQAAAASSVAQAIGGGASVAADGRIVMPTLALSSLGSGQSQPTTILGAVSALDRSLDMHEAALQDVSLIANSAEAKAEAARRQLQGFGPDETVAARIDEVKRNSLAWDPAQTVYNAANGSGDQNRISNLAAGQAATDAVNKGQLDQAVADLKAQGAGLVQERDGQLQIGRDAGAATVNLSGATPQRDANGNAALDANGNAVMAATDRTLTGVAAGVNANDAVNKAQLDGVAQTAAAAQSAAQTAQRVADAAQGVAAGAQQTAAAAQDTAASARQTADSALTAANSARAASDTAAAKLTGIGAGETVAGRIDAAAQTAVDAAGREAGQALADALGGGSTVGADGKASAPAYAISQIGADGQLAAQGQTASNVGDALSALDGNVIKVNERVLAQDAKVGGLTQELADLRGDSLLWDQNAGAFSAAHGADAPNRIVNLAAGEAATDAVNKGQLDAVAQTATAAGTVAQAAQNAAAAANTVATGAQQTAAAAQSAADGARDVAAGAQGTAATAQRVAQEAQATATQAQQTADGAQAAANGARQTADAAQATAAQALQRADGAQGTAAAAQQTASAAQVAATGAQRTADAAQTAAGNAQQSADAANAKLAGIGDGETVAGRIDAAAQAAANAAGRAAGQSLADALGGGSTVGADGKSTAPVYGVGQIGADGQVAAQGQALSTVGAAVAALDDNIIKVNERVLAQDEKVGGLTQDLSDLRGDSLLWDQGAGAFSAAHNAETPNRIVNLAAGQAATDAVNKGQLDQAVADLRAQGAGLLQERDGQLQVGANSAATSVNLAGSTPQRDADGNVLRDADGNALTTPVDRTLSGVANGVNANDAVNKGQLDAVAQSASAAQDSATGAQRTADAAQGVATEAQRAASNAQTAAAGAQQTADAAQLAASGAQQSADAANARLAGLGDGETVAGRIDQAAKTAADAAGRTAAQSLADALGGGSTVSTDGKPSAPAYAVSQISADGQVATPAQTANNVGGALAAIDANVIKVNERVVAQDGKLGALTQDLDDLRGDSLLWDQNAGAYSAARGADAANRIVNVAAGQAGTDAVNKGQLDTVAQATDTAQSDATAAQLSANTAQGAATQAQRTADAAQGAATNAQRSADVATAKLAGIGEGETVAARLDQAAQTAGRSLADALGGGAAVRADGSVQAPTYAVTAIGAGGNALPHSASTVSDALKTIDDSVVAVNNNVNQVGVNVSTMRDQLNAGQLGLVQQDAATRDITVARQADGTRVTLDGAAGARTLSGVKAGEVSATSTEAVVGSQLFTVNQDLLANTQALGSLETLAGQQGAALGSLSALVDSGNVGLTRHDPASNTVSLAADRGGNTVDVSGADGGRQVTGVRDGRIQAGSADAVTGGQLHAVTERVTRLDAQGSGVAVDSRGDGSDRAVVRPGSGAVAVGANAQAVGANSVATGAGAGAQGANSSAMGAGAQAQAAGSTAVGANAKASAPGSVAIGAGAEATRANTVSVGSAGAERQITHVAPASQDTDAVNLRQATDISRQEAGRALQQANRYTDSKIGQLRSETHAGIASAMAIANLPSTATPGKSMFALGTALYSGQSAIAMGVSGRSHNGAWAYRASSSSTTDGTLGAAVGVGYEW